MMRVTPFTIGDLPTLPSLQPEGWADLSPVFRFYTTSEFCMPVKVTTGPLTIGVGCAIRFEGTAWLAHIIVHSEHRRRGAGSLIVEHLLTELTDLEVISVSLIASDDGYPLYERFGFTEDRQYGVYSTASPSPPADRLHPIEAARMSDSDHILALDELVSGEKRARLLDTHISSAFVARHDGSVCGVYLPTLGEGLIESSNEGAGLDLLSYHLQTHKKCVVPVDNRAAVSLLLANGYYEIRRVWRMSRGIRPAWHPEWIYSRIAGNLG